MNEALEAAMKRHWGYDRFLPLQRKAMECVLAGRDSVVVLPTGGGKSLCYQAPALVAKGPAVVVSPLISLMKDQVDGLRERGVAAARLDSSLTEEERRRVYAGLREGGLQLLYVSPERLLMEGFLDHLRGARPAFLAVDEAHCISHWGHDFRPEYRRLGLLREALPGIALHAYTATATPKVREDVALQLRLENPAVLVGSFDRPNLVYRVAPADRGRRLLREALDRHRGEAGIVYAIRRADVDALAAELSSLGYPALPYHAGLSDEKRRLNQERFLREEAVVMVATVAFGMGIDRPDVRFVLHAGMPKSLEHYLQESGRAGRDGLEAECLLLYSGADFLTWKALLGGLEPEVHEAALQKLNEMAAYCRGTTCRHRVLVGYFGQELGGDECGACDVCLGELEVVPAARETAQKILSCVLRLKERFGADYTTQVLTGSSEQRILANGHQALSTYGLLAQVPRQSVRDWIEQLCGQGFLVKQGEYGVLGVTPEGWALLKGGREPRLLKPAAKRARRESKAARAGWEGVDRPLFEELRALRKRIAAERGLLAYMVFGDETLRDMARKRPLTRQAFLAVRGVGEVKAAQYGERFLALIRDHGAGGGP
ncbi:MAG: DNA helicase RecQ [Acidobacteriota bacterium]